MQQIRQPAVAGSFYSGDRETLEKELFDLLKVSRMESGGNSQDDIQSVPKAIIVPHAGYIYSGPTAAAAYSRLYAVRDNIKRVVLLGPVHRVPVRGLALPGADVFTTPLGEIEIDQSAVTASFRRGLLEVVMPKTAEARTSAKNIPIDVA